MDADTTLAMSGIEEIENGLHQNEELGENLESNVKLNEDKSLNLPQEITEPESHSTSNPKEIESNMSDDLKNLKPLKSTGRGKSGKPLSQSIDGNITSEQRPRQTSTLKTKSKSLNERKCVDPAPKTEEISQSSSPPSGDAKPLKLGSLPAYSFSFKCHERAEKRKEFYSKLEEKIQAKEAEKNHLQAKTKESQDAEMKMMRKKLGFKATPLPSFYLEPTPPKVELKKTPTTRAKSPKLGRRKSSAATDTEESGDHHERPGRLSLDAKLSQVRKPHRQSLPIPFEDSDNFSYEKKKIPSRKSKTTTVPKEMSEAVGSDKLKREEGSTNIDVELPEAQEETIQVQEANED